MKTLAFYIALFFLVLFAVVCILHLKASLREDDEARRRTKIFIIPLLLGFYLFAALDAQTDPNSLFIDALLLAWAGDSFIMNATMNYVDSARVKLNGLTLSGYCFFISHVLLIVLFVRAIDYAALFGLSSAPATATATIFGLPLPLIIFIFLAAALCVGAFFSIKHVFAYAPRTMRFNCCAYLATNALTNLAALALFTSCLANPLIWWRTVFFVVGAVLYFISDRFCISVRINPATRVKTHFPDMLFYILAIALITFGALALPL